LNLLKDKISTKEAKIGIIGIGYVGLPLAIEFANKGFEVVGFDSDINKIEILSEGKSYIKHISTEAVRNIVNSGHFRSTDDYSAIKNIDVIIMCVPTPLTKNREPDMSYICSACETILPYMHCGQIIILESTTYPGTCDDVVQPILSKSGLMINKDYYLAYSPEREDPNNLRFNTSNTPKIVSCDDPNGLLLVKNLYDNIVVRTVPVSSVRVAEASKLLENIFRSVNIALMNELKVVFSDMDIDIWEAIAAASTKPFGFMPFYPGPGLGGHCIPIDPFYLTWKAREYGHYTKFIELAGEINSSMPLYVVNRTIGALNKQKKSINGSSILIVGVAYKKDVDDIRESPSLKLIELLEAMGAVVNFYDPYIPEIPHTREHPNLSGRKGVEIGCCVKHDCTLIATDHTSINYDFILKEARCIVDTRNVFPRHEKVILA